MKQMCTIFINDLWSNLCAVPQPLFDICWVTWNNSFVRHEKRVVSREKALFNLNRKTVSCTVQQQFGCIERIQNYIYLAVMTDFSQADLDICIKVISSDQDKQDTLYLFNLYILAHLQGRAMHAMHKFILLIYLSIELNLFIRS